MKNSKQYLADIEKMIRRDFFQNENSYLTKEMYDELARVESGDIKKTSLEVGESYTYRIVLLTLKAKKRLICSKIFEANETRASVRFGIVISVLENNIDSYYCKTLFKENNKEVMSTQDKEEFYNLYEYIQEKVLCLKRGENEKFPSLSKNVVLRLKGLHCGKIYDNKKVKATKKNYSYKTIQDTFTICLPSIQRAFSQKRFRDIEHKCFYAIAIVSNKIEEVDNRIKQAEQRKNSLLIELEKKSSLYENTNKKEEVYGYTKKSDSKNRDRYKDFW